MDRAFLNPLFEKSLLKTDRVSLEFTRYLMHRINWSGRMTGIKGARGTGKTTLMLQRMNQNLPRDHTVLYVSMDDMIFAEYRLTELADTFVRQGGKHLFLDEVHRYPGNWSQEMKLIYDDLPQLTVVFSGSSILHLLQGGADLSRRMVMHELAGLSFREYLSIVTGSSLAPVTWHNILSDHTRIAGEILAEINPLEYFHSYLTHGYYPFFLDDKDTYLLKLSETINVALHMDLPLVTHIPLQSIENIKKLLWVLSESVPFRPNISKLSERTGISRNTLIQYFGFLEDLRIIKRIYADTKGITTLQKPDKVLMHHPNLHYALSRLAPEQGSIRESFFVNQTGMHDTPRYLLKGDYRIENDIFEIGGRTKTAAQIKAEPNGYIAADDLQIGIRNKIPLWLFGFLY